MRNIPFKLFVCFPNEMNTQHSFTIHWKTLYLCFMCGKRDLNDS